MAKLYNIKRVYEPSLNRKAKMIRKNVTLEEAREHCNRKDTEKENEWFDCYSSAE